MPDGHVPRLRFFWGGRSVHLPPFVVLVVSYFPPPAIPPPGHAHSHCGYTTVRQLTCLCPTLQNKLVYWCLGASCLGKAKAEAGKPGHPCQCQPLNPVPSTVPTPIKPGQAFHSRSSASSCFHPNGMYHVDGVNKILHAGGGGGSPRGLHTLHSGRTRWP